MRKYFSVFYLTSRQSFYKIIALMCISGIVQYIFFQKELDALSSFNRSNLTGYRDLERVTSLSAINVIYAATVVAVLVLLTITGTAFGSKCNYTIKRLSVSEKAYFYIQSIYNIIVLVFLLGFEILLTFVFSNMYIAVANKDFISNQSIFLAYYRNDFLHSLLPLADTLIIIRNALQIFALSLAASFLSYKQRRGKKSVAVIFLTVFSIIWNSGEIGGSLSVMLTYFICAAITAFIIIYVKNGWGENDDYYD